MALRSDRLELRPLYTGDAKFVESLYADARVTRTLIRIQGPISIEEAQHFCQASTAADGERRFAAELQADGKAIGVGTVSWRAERFDVTTIGYSVLPAFWAQGYGTELASLLVEFAAGTLGAREIRATTLDDNPASERVLEKLGFTVVEARTTEVDSRGDERCVKRWVLYRRSRQSGPAAEQQARAARLDAGRSA
jgi:RimJ/RimL family protein N-acetyltransferase